MVQIFKISDLENESLHSDLIQSQNVEWDSKDKECTHINYLFINHKWYLIVGYIGEFEIYNEDGSKRYFSSATAPVPINVQLLKPAYLCSCVGYFPPDKEEENVYIVLGTSKGEIFQVQITKNNSVLVNENLKFEYDTKHAIMGLASDKKTGALLVGTNQSYILHFQLNNNKQMTLLTQHSSSKQTNVNTIQTLKCQKENKFVVGL